MRKALLVILALMFSFPAFAQKYQFSGKVLERGTDIPVEFATIVMPDKELWAVANAKGEFVISGVSQGRTKVEISCLGYAPTTFEIEITKDLKGVTYYLSIDDLTLESAVVTARENTNSATTSRQIDRTALEHMQMVNISDISSLLPGGVSANSGKLTSSTDAFQIRSDETAISSFGTAVELDGVRLSNNAAYSAVSGVSTRNIASSNVESIEIITGVPSVEHGDMTNGVVRINTRKGKSPWMVTAMTSPNTKQLSLSKGFDLGSKGGVINASAERTTSVHDLASPFTTYQRNAFSLIYSNSFDVFGQPLRFSTGVSGNVGGYDRSADPDSFMETYEKVKENTIRGNFSLNWLLNKSWITNIELTGSVVYSDNLTSISENKSSSSSTSSLHGMEEGYFVSTPYASDPNAEVTLRPAGYWYEVSYRDNKPIDYNLHLKINWAHNFRGVVNKLKLGAHFTSSGNLGEGLYYEDLSKAPDWRPYPYKDIPFVNNLAAYAEENVTIPIGTTSLNLVGGVRSEWTMINNSGYGTVSSLSPRFNAKYSIIKYRRSRILRELSVRGSWGVAVKLPSVSILYPTPSYYGKQVFAPGTMADGTAFYAYYILPRQIEYNPDLKWQRAQQSEIGVEADIAGVKISLAAFYSKTLDSYFTYSEYEPFTYKWTDQRNLEGCPIPSSDRLYSIDRQTGVVTVKDITGNVADQTLAYSEKNTFTSKTKVTNEVSPTIRKGIEWVIDFGQIPSIRTSIRMDGTLYKYRSINENIVQAYQTNRTMSDGITPYQFIGYYVGSSSGTSNGSESLKLRNNITFTTHIPKARLIFTLRLEGSLYRHDRNLAEYSGGQIAWPMSGQEKTPSGTEFYDIKGHVVKYPLYYSTFEEPNIQIPFLEEYLWAKENNKRLFSELDAMINKTGYTYTYLKNVFSPYFSANISVTKEIGRIASLSFYANNFFYSTMRFKQSASETDVSLFESSSYIPKFYYGLTLRLKIQ
ncbi:MAG: TonB-dependent receptor [Bacteroidales bacterium]|nr:TonB-dependent receptor [Bacteroidales bacterium]